MTYRPTITSATLALTALAFAAIAWPPVQAVAGDYVSEKPAAGHFPLVAEQTAADVFVAEDDWKVARIAARDLRWTSSA